MKKEPKFKWATPHDWLQDAWGEGDISESRLLDLVLKMDADTLQDAFEKQMEDDGYFDDLNAVEEDEDDWEGEEDE